MEGTMTALGLVAGFCTTFCFVPQVVRAWRTRSTRDLSPAMLAVLALGTVLWLAYGLLLDSLPLIATNVCALALQAILVTLKRRHG
jgi:MtN3 and saliva related transmembrane protein